MMTITCRIEFENNPSGAYYSGQLMRGIIHLTLTGTEERVFHTAIVRIIGDGRVSWTEQVPVRRYDYAQKRNVTEYRTEVRKKEQTFLHETKHFIVGKCLQ